MKDGPAFQLYADVFFIDTAEWDPYEIGVYWRMLLLQWANGSISSDEKVLQKVTGSSPKKFQKAAKNVLKKFVLCNDGRLRNVKLEEIREKQQEYRESQREKGKKGAKKRWPKTITPAIATAKPELIPDDSHDGHKPDDSSSSSSSFKKKINKRKSGTEATDEQWLGELQVLECYSHLNIEHQLQKCQAHFKLRHIQVTRKRFLGWLNHPLNAKPMVLTKEKPDDPYKNLPRTGREFKDDF
jgi:uncharacterized protein YdaU (DUF1376 family)